MGIKHGFVSSVVDIGGPTYVQPTHWNAPHLSPPIHIWDFAGQLAAASFGIPSTAGGTGFEFPNNTGLLRQRWDFTNIDNVYLAVGLASVFGLSASASLRLQYSPSGFPGSWYSFDATAGSAPFVSVASGNTASLYLLGSNGMRFGPTGPVSAAAKALPQPLNIRVAGYGGSPSGIGVGNIDSFGF